MRAVIRSSSPVSSSIDRAGIALSSVCLMHCVALPLLAIALPVLGTFAEAEAVHRVFAVGAALAAALAFGPPIPSGSAHTRTSGPLRALAALGVASLLLGAFMEALHDYEVLLTVSGAVMLTVAHLRRLRRLE